MARGGKLLHTCIYSVDAEEAVTFTVTVRLPSFTRSTKDSCICFATVKGAVGFSHQAQTNDLGQFPPQSSLSQRFTTPSPRLPLFRPIHQMPSQSPPHPVYIQISFSFSSSSSSSSVHPRYSRANLFAMIQTSVSAQCQQDQCNAVHCSAVT